MPFNAMPGPSGEESGRLEKPGTTVCVRLDPRKETGPLDLGAVLDRVIFASPVPVMHDGALVGGDREELLEQPWCEPTEWTVPDEHVRRVEEVLGVPFENEIKVHLRPLALTAHTPSPSFKGQLAVVYATGVPDLSVPDEGFGSPVSRTLTVRLIDGRVRLEASVDVDEYDLAGAEDVWNAGPGRELAEMESAARRGGEVDEARLQSLREQRSRTVEFYTVATGALQRLVRRDRAERDRAPGSAAARG